VAPAIRAAMRGKQAPQAGRPACGRQALSGLDRRRDSAPTDGSPMGFGSDRDPARISARLRGLAAIPGENRGLMAVPRRALSLDRHDFSYRSSPSSQRLRIAPTSDSERR